MKVSNGLLPQARRQGAGCGDVLVGAILSRAAQQVSPPAIAGGVEIEDEESQSVDQAIDLHGTDAPMRPIWQGLKLVVAVWC